MQFSNRAEMIEWLRPQVLVTPKDMLITASDGTKLSWLINSRDLFGSRTGLEFMAKEFWRRFENDEVLQIATPETAGIPLVAAIVMMTPAGREAPTGIMVRKSRKKTGMGRALEGPFRPVPTIMIDDIINSGGSLMRAAAKVEAEGGTIQAAFALCDFLAPSSAGWRAKRKLRVEAVVHPSDFGLTSSNGGSSNVAMFDIVWQHHPGTGDPFHGAPKSAPAFDGVRVFSGTDTGLMRAVDAASGKQVWAFDAQTGASRKGIWSAPAVHEGRVHFGAYNGNAYCLDAASGDLVWKTSCCDFIGASPAIVPRHGLVLYGLEFAQARAKGAITALSLSDGSIVWQHGNSRLQHGSAAYSAEFDRIYWGTADYDLVCIEPASGDIEWSFRTQRSIKYAPAIDEERGLIAVGSFDHHVYVLDARTGEEKGRFETADIVYTTPLFANGKLYFGSADKKVYMVDLDTMTIEATAHTEGRVFASPVAYKDMIVVGATSGLLGLDPDTLKRKAAWISPDGVSNAPVKVDDDLVVLTVKNDLYRVRLGEWVAP